MPNPAFLLYRTGASLIQIAPKPLVRWIVRLISRLAVRFARQKRALMARHLQRVFAHQSAEPATPSQLQAAVKSAFHSYARYWADTARLPKLTPAELDSGFTFIGWDFVEDARSRGPGPILALPHLGNWEWAGMWLTQVPKVPVSVVVEMGSNEELFRWMMSFRERMNMHIIPLDADAGTAASKALADGHILCLLCDRDIQGTGVPVDFFGEETTLPAGAATLALRSGAAVLPAAVYYQGAKQLGVVRPALDAVRQGRFRSDAQRMTQDLAKNLERLIAHAPEQWHLMSPNWPSDYEFLKREFMKRGSSAGFRAENSSGKKRHQAGMLQKAADI